MGLLQKAYETYEAHQALAGVYEVGKAPLAPVGHNTTTAKYEVTLDAQGNFRRATEMKSEANQYAQENSFSDTAANKNALKIIIPVTEKSAGRTSTTIAPHPLCEQVGYLTPDNDKKYAAYMEQLTDWAESEYSHPKVKAVLAYVSKGTLKADLTDAGIKKFGDNDFICWRVLGTEGDSDACYKDRSLFDSYTAYYLHRRQQESTVLCMVSGEQVVPAEQHLKGIYSRGGSAKLISVNDEVNFTYRGRFMEEVQALTVGYEVSQKVHNVLKWLIANQGVSIAKELDEKRQKKPKKQKESKCIPTVYLCWNPQGLPVKKLNRPTRESDAAKKLNPSNYQSVLYKTLMSYKAELPKEAGVVIAAFDAATTGRLSLTYYNELQLSDYLDRLVYWDSTCCFIHRFKGTLAPGLDDIILYAWGIERKTIDDKGEEKCTVEVDDKVMKQQMQRLVHCRVDKALMPLDIMQALVIKASNPLTYDLKNASNNWDEVLFTACAVIRKYYIDHKKEELEMALQPDKMDRSYQFGRLLAVMELIERSTYDEEKKESRCVPNAIRMYASFCQRPSHTTHIIMQQLQAAYIPQLKYSWRVRYEKLVGEIMEKLSDWQDANPNANYDAPLSETYLMGYYLQKNALYKKNDENTEEESDE